MAGRFGSASIEEIDEKKKNASAKRTLQGNKMASGVFREYFLEKGIDSNFEEFDEHVLDDRLARFYIDARKKDGTKYKSGSLESIRHGINRYLKAPPFNKPFDVIKDSQFRGSNQTYEAARADLKQAGLGTTVHYPEIPDCDLQKLYSSMYLSQSTPSGLFNKVQFDIRMYFCRRGAENMHMMSKTTFSLKIDPESGLQYITKSADELTKNHRGNDKENTTGSMPEIPGDSPYCPVTSFLKYSQKLHPDCDRLWQRPKDTFCEDDDTWYCNVPVGEKKLKSFLPDLSVACKLTQRYTNHSIRATCATILSRGKYNYAQIKAVTGHKSVQSLSIYQKENDKEKLQMGQAISQSLTLQPSLPPPPKRQALEYQYGHEYTSSTDIANKSTMPGLEGVDVEKLFSDFDSCEASTSVRTCTAYAMPTSSNPYVFNNCSVQIIQNLNVRK